MNLHDNYPALFLVRLINLFTACFFTLFLYGCARDNPINPNDPLESRGDFDIYISDVSIPNIEEPEKPLNGKLYLPSVDNGKSFSKGTFELIVLTPGFAASFTLYQRFALHFVSHGFIVLGIDFVPNTNALDGAHDYKARQVGYAIDYALSAESGVADYISPAGVGLAGHSMGAKVGFFAASIDTRISVIAAMDPSNAGGPPCFISPSNCDNYPVAPNPFRDAIGILEEVNVASLILRAEPDPLFNPAQEFNASWFFKGYDEEGLYALKAPSVYINMGNTSHAAFIPLISQSVAAFSKRTMTAWFMTHLRGDSMEAYYDGDIIQTDIDEGRIVGVNYRY